MWKLKEPSDENQKECHEIQPNPSKDRPMPEGESVLFDGKPVVIKSTVPPIIGYRTCDINCKFDRMYPKDFVRSPGD
jgi:hypothetical protein